MSLSKKYSFFYSNYRKLIKYYFKTKIFFYEILSYLIIIKYEFEHNNFQNQFHKKNILILRNRYLRSLTKDNKKKSPEGIIFKSFKNMNLKEVEFKEFFIDDYSNFFSLTINLLNYLKKNNFYAIIFSQWSPDERRQILKSVIKFLKKKYKLFNLFHDTVDYGSVRKAFVNSSIYFEASFCSDNPLLYGFDSKIDNIKFLPWPMYSFNYNKIKFHETDRKIDIAFLGMVEGYRDYRIKFIKFIEENFQDCNLFLKLFLFPDEKIDNDEYRYVLKNSKIIINFSQSLSNSQLKYRVYEAIHHGAVLFESENDQIKYQFNAYQHYVPFYDELDLKNKLKYYLNNKNNLSETSNYSQLRLDYLRADPSSCKNIFLNYLN